MFERSFKVIFLGDNAVGKTSLLNRFLRGEFRPEYIPTIKTSISEKEFRFSKCLVRLMLWDTDGEAISDEVGRDYCTNAQAAVIVYDVCRLTSLKGAEKWYRTMTKYTDKKPVVWLVGNKLDLKENRVVDRAEAEKIARELGLGYMETSVKTGENVEALLTSVLRDLIRTRLDEVKKGLEG